MKVTAGIRWVHREMRDEWVREMRKYVWWPLGQVFVFFCFYWKDLFQGLRQMSLSSVLRKLYHSDKASQEENCG